VFRAALPAMQTQLSVPRVRKPAGAIPASSQARSARDRVTADLRTTAAKKFGAVVMVCTSRSICCVVSTTAWVKLFRLRAFVGKRRRSSLNNASCQVGAAAIKKTNRFQLDATRHSIGGITENDPRSWPGGLSGLTLRD